MKSFIKMIGIIAVVGLLFASCGGDDEPPPATTTDTDLTGLSEVKATGQKVYTMSINYETGAITFTEFKGNVTFNQPTFATATIVNGMLSYNFGTPPTDELESVTELSDDLKDMYTNFTLSPNNASFTILWGFSNPEGYNVRRGLLSFSGNPSSEYTDTSGELAFLYVDRDVTIKGTGKTFRDETYVVDSITERSIDRTTNINLELKRGWNMFRADYIRVSSIPSANNRLNDATWSYSIDNPASFRWILQIP